MQLFLSVGILETNVPMAGVLADKKSYVTLYRDMYGVFNGSSAVFTHISG